jgi:hypothetical protein
MYNARKDRETNATRHASQIVSAGAAFRSTGRRVRNDRGNASSRRNAPRSRSNPSPIHDGHRVIRELDGPPVPVPPQRCVPHLIRYRLAVLVVRPSLPKCCKHRHTDRPAELNFMGDTSNGTNSESVAGPAEVEGFAPEASPEFRRLNAHQTVHPQEEKPSLSLSAVERGNIILKHHLALQSADTTIAQLQAERISPTTEPAGPSAAQLLSLSPKRVKRGRSLTLDVTKMVTLDGRRLGETADDFETRRQSSDFI